jgi:hypothetical protein
MTAVLVVTIKVEQVEQVANGRHVPRNVQIVVIITHARIRQIVAAAGAEGGMEHPVPFDKFDERRMLVIDVADMATSRERRYGDHGNAWACPEEINRLDEAGVIVTAALVHGDKDGSFRPLFRLLCASSTMF